MSPPPPVRERVQSATNHLDLITQLIREAQPALDASWETGPATAVLAQIKAAASQAEAALHIPEQEHTR